MIINPYIFVSIDPDAQAFLTATGITDSTISAAINTLCLDLKGNNLWNKMKAVYPFVGGTATTHKWNLKDPQDTNTAFRLTFHGGITHTINGIIGAVNGYANSYLIPSNVLNLNSTHISYYSRTTQVNSGNVEMGTNVVGNQGGTLLIIKYSDGNAYFRVNSPASYITYTNTDSKGFYMSNRTAVGVINGWKNNIKVANGTFGSGITSNLSILLNAWNNQGSITDFSQKNCAFSSIGDGLDDTEAANFYTIVQNFQTTLSRQV